MIDSEAPQPDATFTGGATAGLTLDARGLRVGTSPQRLIVEDVDLALAPGEILGMVGESGSGKTTTVLSLLGYSPPGVMITDGTLHLAGRPMRMDESMRAFRGTAISYVPQNPGRALNPSLRIVDAIEDVIGRRVGVRPGRVDALSMLEAVGLPGTNEFGRRFPHQLSGGQQQRVCIAMALSCEPAVMVLDEPTTGLDVRTQATILKELLRLRDERQISMVYVTHDLAVVAQIADRIAVMYAGLIVEQGPADQVLRRPRHPYTRGLLASIPDHVAPRALEPMPGIAVGITDRPTGCRFGPRCPQRSEACQNAVPSLVSLADRHQTRCFHADQTPVVQVASRETPHDPQATAPASEPVLHVRELVAEHRSRGETVVAASGISFGVGRGACVALVGESGSGKTTIARVIAGLHPLAGGEVRLGGERLASSAQRRTVDQRRRIQIVFQNPADALNPRHSAYDSIARPARLLRGLSRADARTEVDRLLTRVRLPARVARRYPYELSGGERQRVAIARALAADPQLILCDEITSALDVSVQAAVLSLLAELRRDLGLALLFITHDLGVVATVADDVLVLDAGVICEQGPTADVLNHPTHRVTQQLIDAAPSVATAIREWDIYEASRATRDSGARSDER